MLIKEKLVELKCLNVFLYYWFKKTIELTEQLNLEQ